MREEVKQRALDAINRMMRDGIGVMEASRLARTSRRTVKKFMKREGIRTLRKKGKLKIVPSMKQRINAFILHMNRGYSATASAKAVGTTVRTMARKTVNGIPIIVKVDRRWELNVLPIFRHSIVVYGRITGLGDNVQGSGALPKERILPPTAQSQEEASVDDGDIKSPDADTAIWFQVDFNNFLSTLPRNEVGRYYTPLIMQALKNQLETADVVDTNLVEKFKNNDDVLSHSSATGRLTDDEITRLEQILNRYDVSLMTPANYGVDDNFIPDEVEFIGIDALGEETSLGDFQIFMLRDDEPAIYPSDSSGNPVPEVIVLDYNLADELDY